jgi:pilus assembly protein CpaE
MDLGDVVEPGTTVLVIGEPQNVNFYRTVTKGMGVREYLPKPLTRPAVETNFLPLMQTGSAGAAQTGGRMVALAGARGGVGTSTIAGNLAWMIGVEMHRHTLLLDADLYRGTLALGLNVKHHAGLCLALQSPERIDQLLIERATQKAGQRLHVLSALETLTKVNPYHDTAADVLAQALRARYNFVLADTGTALHEFARDLNYLAHRKIVVLDPTQIAIRNFERLLTLASGPLQSPKHILVLNMAGRPGGLTQQHMEQALGLSFDVVIPDLPRIVPKAAQYGQPAAALRGPFRTAMTQLATALGAELSAKAA